MAANCSTVLPSPKTISGTPLRAALPMSRQAKSPIAVRPRPARSSARLVDRRASGGDVGQQGPQVVGWSLRLAHATLPSLTTQSIPRRGSRPHQRSTLGEAPLRKAPMIPVSSSTSGQDVSRGLAISFAAHHRFRIVAIVVLAVAAAFWPSSSSPRRASRRSRRARARARPRDSLLVSVALPGAAHLHALSVSLDGRDVTPVVRSDAKRLYFTTGRLAQGPHTVRVTARTSDLLRLRLSKSWRFDVDTVTPTLALSGPRGGAVVTTDPVALGGTTEPGAMVLASAGTQTRGPAPAPTAPSPSPCRCPTATPPVDHRHRPRRQRRVPAALLLSRRHAARAHRLRRREGREATTPRRPT